MPGSQALAKDPAIAAILLAAGSSRRFGAGNKLLADTGGMPLIRRVALALLASRAGRLLVVTGHDPSAIKAALAGLNLAFVHCERHLDGMGHSVAAGVAGLPSDIRAVVISTGDMPELSADLIDRLIAEFNASNEDPVVHPVLADGTLRNPVLWPRKLFGELMRLTGDKGGRALLGKPGLVVKTIPLGVDDLIDIDRPEDLAQWRARNA